MWGSLNSVLIQSTRPGMSPSPAVGRTSELSSKRSCIPRQIPKMGFFSACKRISLSSPEARNFSAASGKAPTPGRMMASARSNSPLSAEMTEENPKISRALATLFRLPTP